MTPEEMATTAASAIQDKTRLTMVVPRPWKNRPRKFPKGILLCQQEKSNVYSFDPLNVIAWLASNGLIKVIATTIDEKPPNP